MRVLTSPGVTWNEIDKSGYSPAMAPTACFVQGFANKGEPYAYKQFTSRAAWTSYYGEPDNEAERYFYAAVCEVLNQGGTLYCARLPYDNVAFEKMVGIKYNVKETLTDLSDASLADYQGLSAVDPEIDKAFVIEGGKDPALYDLSAIDEYRTDEAKVPAGSFLIVDTTGATYGKVAEDKRIGVDREVIGIVPVVTTAANALYAQNMLQLSAVNQVSCYESINGEVLKNLVATDKNGTIIKVDGREMKNGGLSAADFAKRINTQGKWYFQTYEFETNTAFLSGADGDVLSSLSVDNERKLSVIKPNGAVVQTSITLSACASRFENRKGFYLDSTSPTETFADINSFKPLVNDSNHITGWSGLIAGPKQHVKNPELTSTSELTSTNAWETDAPINEWHGVDGDDSIPETMALDANNYFSTIQPAADGTGVESEHLKDIGVIIYKTYLDPSEGNKVSYEPVEAYCGSLCKDDVDPNTGVTKFIDTIINSQSQYVNFFSNCFNNKTSKKAYNEDCDILIAKPSQGAALGLYSPMTKEDISVSKSIYDGMNKAFDKVTDLNKLNIDIVCDAGIANIASYLKAIYGDKGPYDLQVTDDLGNSMLGLWTCKKATDASVKTWKTVEQKFDNFCKNVRRDCMFIADGMRPLVLQGQKKIIRDSKPANTIDANILPYFPAICGLNTSYGAGYCDWFEQADDYSGDFFWCPPSIKAMGIYLNTDINYNYWDAPAGLNRGMVAATDVSFSPTPAQAGCFYQKNWNYAVNYPDEGIVLEGQKTFQVKPSAFDRVNVRRLFLRLERQSYKVARYYVYDGNTAYTRQRLVDALDPYFKEAKVGGGIYDYKIVCDESNNSGDTIDRNELHVSIAIKPTKTIEFIYLNFIAGRTNSTWEELLG